MTSFRSTMLVLAVCLTLIALGGGKKLFETGRTASTVQTLEQELGKLRRDVDRIQKDLKDVRATGSSSKNAQPIVPVQIKLDGSHRNDPFLGNKDAPFVVMAFVDYQCRPCRKFIKETFPKLRQEYIEPGKVQYILRDHPLPKNRHAHRAAMVAHCAGEQSQYWAMHDTLFSQAPTLDAGDWLALYAKVRNLDHQKLNRCVDSRRYAKEVARDVSEGSRMGLKGAPGFFIGTRAEGDQLDGIFVRGAQPYQVFDEYLKHLAKGAST